MLLVRHLRELLLWEGTWLRLLAIWGHALGLVTAGGTDHAVVPPGDYEEAHEDAEAKDADLASHDPRKILRTIVRFLGHASFLGEHVAIPLDSVEFVRILRIRIPREDSEKLWIVLLPVPLFERDVLRGASVRWSRLPSHLFEMTALRVFVVVIIAHSIGLLGVLSFCFFNGL